MADPEDLGEASEHILAQLMKNERRMQTLFGYQDAAYG